MLKTILDQWRFRRGLRWVHRRPTLYEAKRWAEGQLSLYLIFLGVLVLYGIAGRIDYDTAIQAEAERQQVSEAKHQEEKTNQQKRLEACLNGGSPGYYYYNTRGERLQIMCPPAYELNLGKE